MEFTTLLLIALVLFLLIVFRHVLLRWLVSYCLNLTFDQAQVTFKGINQIELVLDKIVFYQVWFEDPVSRVRVPPHLRKLVRGKSPLESWIERQRLLVATADSIQVLIAPFQLKRPFITATLDRLRIIPPRESEYTAAEQAILFPQGYPNPHRFVCSWMERSAVVRYAVQTLVLFLSKLLQLEVNQVQVYLTEDRPQCGPMVLSMERLLVTLEPLMTGKIGVACQSITLLEKRPSLRMKPLLDLPTCILSVRFEPCSRIADDEAEPSGDDALVMNVNPSSEDAETFMQRGLVTATIARPQYIDAHFVPTVLQMIEEFGDGRMASMFGAVGSFLKDEGFGSFVGTLGTQAVDSWLKYASNDGLFRVERKFIVKS
jgi:hypothetical protein